MTILLLVIFAFALPDFSYLYWRLGNGVLDAVFLSLPFLLLATFPMKKIHRLHRGLIYLSLGVITYLTLMALVRDVVYLLGGELFSAEWVYLATLILIIGGTLHAYLGPHIKHVKLAVKNLHPDLENFKIAQISDLHVGPTIRKKYVRKVLTKTNSLNADLITMTGDIADGPVKIYREDMAPFADLTSTFGTYYVTGNHEYYWGGQEWINVMKDLGIKPLVNRGETVKVKAASILVSGIPDPVSGVKPELEIILQSAQNADFKILLSHRPGIARLAESLGYDLQLSGHTHGGQFFPWTLVVKFVHEFSRGLDQVGKMWIYVNMGTGSWGPFLRVGSTTEITLLELIRDES